MKKMQKTGLWTFSVLLLLLVAPKSYGQTLQSYDARFAIQYPVGKTTIDPKHANNYYATEELKRFFHMVDIARVDSIVVIGSSSPEGEGRRNFALAYERAESLQSFICAEFPYVSRNLMHLYAKGDTWPDMLRTISRDPNFPNKNHTLIVLGADQPYTERLKLLKFLEYKDSHNYLTRILFPRLRNATAFVIYYKSEEPFVVYDTPEEFEKRPEIIGAPVNVPLPFVAPALQESAPTIVVDTIEISSSEVEPRVKKPLFAFKTNLLFDAATLVNLSVEVPIGRHFSVAGEVIFPWWLNEKKQNALQILSGNLEVKYWFSPRDNQPRGQFSVMTGWFAGVYGGGGYYDLEYNGKGYQGESIFSVGLMGGYAHSIGKCLRMEYSIGLGYMQTHYRRYEAGLDNAGKWELVRQESGLSSQWFGPTQAKISLVWLLNKNMKKGGVN